LARKRKAPFQDMCLKILILNVRKRSIPGKCAQEESIYKIIAIKYDREIVLRELPFQNSTQKRNKLEQYICGKQIGFCC
jgi:hypothetical protein